MRSRAAAPCGKAAAAGSVTSCRRRRVAGHSLRSLRKACTRSTLSRCRHHRSRYRYESGMYCGTQGYRRQLEDSTGVRRPSIQSGGERHLGSSNLAEALHAPPPCMRRLCRRLPSPWPSTCSGSHCWGCRRGRGSTPVRRMAPGKRSLAPHRRTPGTQPVQPGSCWGLAAPAGTSSPCRQATAVMPSTAVGEGRSRRNLCRTHKAAGTQSLGHRRRSLRPKQPSRCWHTACH